MSKPPYRFASPPPDSFPRTVALVGDAVPETALASCAFPWTYVAGVPVVHRSSVFLVKKLGLASGFVDEACRERYLRYARESARSFGDAKLAPSGYDWSRHLTRAWKPRDYQRAGMDRLWARASLCGGTVLADDVGLGKTVQCIGVCERIRGVVGGPVVLVTTVSTLSQWRDEVRRFARAKPVVVLADGKDRVADLARPCDWLVVSYETVRLPQFAAAVDALRPTVVAFDEAYRLSNRETKTQARARELAERAKYVFEFNATPIENGVADLYGQLKLIDPNVLGPWDLFDARYVVRNEGGREVRARNLGELKLRTSGVVLRRTAGECGAEVPEVLAEVRRCEMGKRQLSAYRAAVGEFVSDKSTGAVARAKLARVRYAAFAENVDDDSSDSCKCDDLLSLLKNELAGQRVIVMSRFARVIRFVDARLRATGLRPYVITGATPREGKGGRSDIAHRFASRLGRGSVLLGTEAIQRGLNLQKAGVLVNLDLPWTAGALRQRVGRIARIGQRRDRVLVLNQCAVAGFPTVDQWIESIVVGKRGTSDAFFWDDGVDELGRDTPPIAAVRGFLAEPRITRKVIRSTNRREPR